ncbi:MAG: YgfZ/GcvT domain-containing protein, partial [Spartobacteria bacterium]
PGGTTSVSSTAPLSAYFQVTNRARFELRGPDAIRYLNGQVSIDITRLSPAKARPACLLTAKGQLCAPLQIWRQGDSLIIEGPPELCENIQARLERYIIADDVELLPLPALEPLYHILPFPHWLQNHPALPPGDAPEKGAQASRLCCHSPSTSPTSSHATRPLEGDAPSAPLSPPHLTISRLNLPGYDASDKPTHLPELPHAAIELLRIVSGVPIWGRELTEDTLPQEARLEDHAVDFDKGCYVGQETVSRLKSVGRVNKRLHGFLSSSDFPAGVPLFLRPPGDPSTTAGQITSRARDFDMAQTAALGYLNRQFESLPRFEVADETGRVLGEVERRDFPIL